MLNSFFAFNFEPPLSSDMVLEELINRKGRSGVIPLDPDFEIQNKVRADRSQFKALKCTRRSGKSTTEVLDHIDKCRKNNSLSNLRWATHTTNNQNRTRPKTNKLGHKNITLWVDKRNGNEWYRFTIVRNGKAHTKGFKTLEEAILYRNAYITALGEEIID